MKLINYNLLTIILISINCCVNSDIDSEKSVLAKRKFITKSLKFMQICTNETGQKMNFFELFDPSYVTPEKKCFLACMMSKFGLFENSHSLSINGLKVMAHDLTDGNMNVVNQMEEVGKQCSRIYDDNICEAAYKYDLCILEQVKIRKINFGYSI